MDYTYGEKYSSFKCFKRMFLTDLDVCFKK